MEETLVQPVDIATARANVEAYVRTHDVQYLHPDAEFTNMGSGQVLQGREAISTFLHYFYHIAFDAKAETFNLIVTKDRAVIEGYVVGKHIGEFAGVPATNKDVRFPICVSYELENGVIRRARVYLLSEVLFAQIGTPPVKE